MNDETVWADTQNPLEDISSVFDLFARPEWHARAACRGVGAEVFFPERGELVSAAQAICEGCTVREECLEAAMAVPNTTGIWGGVTERKRRRIRAERRKIAVLVEPKRGELDNCGTDGGYYSHRYRGQPTCEACKAAHAEAVRRAAKRYGTSARNFKRQVRKSLGWCSQCAEFRHDECRNKGCTCTVCNKFAQLPAHDSVKGRLGDDMSTTSVAGVENGKGDPLGDQLEEAG